MKNRRKRDQQRCPWCFGSHGCDKRLDHPGRHECDCGAWCPREEERVESDPAWVAFPCGPIESKDG